MTNEAAGAPQMGHDSQDELRRLAEVYALRSRELSDAVARLGALLVTGKPFRRAITAIEARRVLCDEAADDFFAFLSPAPTGGEMPQETPTTE